MSFSLKTLNDLLFESYCRVIPSGEHFSHPTYNLDNQKLKLITINWPSVYQWNPARTWVCHTLEGFKRYVKVRFSNINQEFKGIVQISINYKNNNFPVAIDYSDYADRIDEVCLKMCAIYFKMQFLKEGYGNSKIKPGLFTPLSLSIYDYLPKFRRIRENKECKYEVYGRFSTEFALDIRKRALEILKGQKAFQFEGDLKKIRYSRYLREVASSKICIDLPGNGDFCFRMIDYLAVGSCIIGFPPRTTLYPPLEDRKHIIYCQPDLSDLVDLCYYYLHNNKEREQIAKNSREYFDRYLHKYQLASFYLLHILKYLSLTEL